jgi:AcrR family transcriptional regulator
MNVPYISTGRANQKARTRDALIAATRGLLSEGRIPTMEDAAAAASISRTTAYRYFPNVPSLLLSAYPHAEEDSLLGDDPPRDPAARLRLVAESQTRRILKYEPEMRAVLRLSLGDEPTDRSVLPMHRGQRIGWIADALEPLRGQMDEETLRDLSLGIGATLGIEAFVWLTDIARLSREDAAATMRLNASRLLRAAIVENDAPGDSLA